MACCILGALVLGTCTSALRSIKRRVLRQPDPDAEMWTLPRR